MARDGDPAFHDFLAEDLPETTGIRIEELSKDPGPKGPALVHPEGMMCVITIAGSVQVSALKQTRGVEVAQSVDFLSLMLAVSGNPIRV